MRAVIERSMIHQVIERWMKEVGLRFSTRDDGSDDLLLATEIAKELKDEIRMLAHKSPEWWEQIRGADPIARTINAVFDIIDGEEPH